MTDLRLTDAHMRTSFDRQARTGAYVARLGQTLGYNSDEFISEAVDTVLAAQADQAAATWAYLSEAGEMFDGRILPFDPPVDHLIGSATHAGTPLETVYRRPAKLAAELRAAGVDEAEVAARVSAEVEQLASTDVAVSGRRSEQVYGSVDKRIIGWRRVPNAGACEYCRLIATKDYGKRDLAPAHASCHCGTAPRFADSDDLVDDAAIARLDKQGVPMQRAQRAKDAARANKLADAGVEVAEVADTPALRGLPPGSSAAADDLELAQVAARYGVTPDEVKAAQGRVKIVRQQLRDEAAVVQQEAFDELYKWNDAYRIKRPARSAADRGGEYDWLEQIDARERARLSRQWYADDGIGVDELPDIIYGPGSDRSTDEAIQEWLRVNRQYEAAGALRRGKLPSTRAYSGNVDVDTLLAGFSDDGYSVKTILGADDLEAAAHIAGVEKDIVTREALDFLGDASTAPVHGPSPYRMSYQAWEEELRTLEYGLREYPSEMPRNAKARLRELVPDLLDDGQDYEELYARIVDTAHRAGEEVPDYAYIPWL